jgi:hypothetical protein
MKGLGVHQEMKRTAKHHDLQSKSASKATLFLGFNSNIAQTDMGTNNLGIEHY